MGSEPDSGNALHWAPPDPREGKGRAMWTTVGWLCGNKTGSGSGRLAHLEYEQVD